MDIFSRDDVDKFFDKFEDPSDNLVLIVDMVNWFYHELPKHKNDYDLDQIKRYFMKRLIMKSYRLGKDHAYASTVATIRGSGLIKKEELDD